MTPEQKKALEGLKAQMTAAFGELNRRLDEYKAGRGEDKKNIERLEATLDVCEKEIEKIVKKAGRLNMGGDDGAGGGRIISLAAHLHQNEEFAELVKGSPARFEMKGSAEIAGGFAPYFSRLHPALKELTSAAGGFGGLPVQAFRLNDIISAPTRAPRIRDLMQVVRLANSNAVEYVEETNWLEVSAKLTAAASGGVTTTLAVDTPDGFIDGATIKIGVGTVNEEEGVIQSVDRDAKTITLDAAVANNHAIDSFVGSSEFDFTPESKVKPVARPTYELQTESVKTLAHFVAVSRQILSDAAALEAYLGMRLELGLALAEERQILYGDGTARQLQGIITHSGILSYNQSAVATDTQIDAIRRGMTLCQIGNLPATGIILHPTDWQNISLLKDAQDRYIWISVNAGGEELLWALPVVVTTAINQGSSLLGSFAMGAALWDREMSTVRASDSHEDFFTRNMVAILAEQRLALTIYRPEAFVAVNFDA